MKTLEDVILQSSAKELEIAVGVIAYNLSFKFQDGNFSEFVKVLNPIARRLISHRNTLVSDKIKLADDIPVGLVSSALSRIGIEITKDEILKFKSTNLGKVIYNIIEKV